MARWQLHITCAELSPIMLKILLMLPTYYASNYAGIMCMPPLTTGSTTATPRLWQCNNSSGVETVGPKHWPNTWTDSLSPMWWKKFTLASVGAFNYAWVQYSPPTWNKPSADEHTSIVTDNLKGEVTQGQVCDVRT